MLSVEIIKRSLFAVFGHLNVVWKIAAFWVLVTIISLMPLLMAGKNSTNQDVQLPWMVTQEWYIWLPLSLVIIFIAIVSAAITAIAWHRFLILDEKPESIIIWPKSWPIGQYFRSGAVLFILPMTIVMVVTILNEMGYDQNAASAQPNALNEFAFSTATNLMIYLVFLVWGLKLPAIAVEKQTHYKSHLTFKFSDSWHYTKQHFVQVFLLALMVSIIFALLEMLQVYVFDFALVVDVKTAIGMALFIVCGYVEMIFTIGILSELHKALVPREPCTSSN